MIWPIGRLLLGHAMNEKQTTNDEGHLIDGRELCRIDGLRRVDSQSEKTAICLEMSSEEFLISNDRSYGDRMRRIHPDEPINYSKSWFKLSDRDCIYTHTHTYTYPRASERHGRDETRKGFESFSMIFRSSEKLWLFLWQRKRPFVIFNVSECLAFGRVFEQGARGQGHRGAG